MFINCIIDPSVYGLNSRESKKIEVDIDPNDEVENLIIIVNLKLTEINPAGLEVYYGRKKLANNMKILKLNLGSEDFLTIKRNSSTCCLLI